LRIRKTVETPKLSHPIKISNNMVLLKGNCIYF
jgi:hypothetical protein